MTTKLTQDQTVGRLGAPSEAQAPDRNEMAGDPSADPDALDPVALTDAGRRSSLRRSVQAIATVLVVATLAGAMISVGLRAREEARTEQITRFEAATGIRVERVVLTAAGGMVELHYWVLDPDKASGVHDDSNPPGLIDQSSGAIIAVPFHNHGYQELHTAVLYREVFMNGGGLLQRGDHVTIVVGDALIEGIEVL